MTFVLHPLHELGVEQCIPQKIKMNTRRTMPFCTLTIPRLASLAAAAILAILAAGCSTPRRMAALEEDVDSLLTAAQQEAFPSRQPEHFQHQTSSDAKQNDAPPAKISLDLRGALQYAAANNRDYQTARDTLVYSALTLRGTLHDWEWNPTNNFSAIFGINQKPSYSTLATESGIGFTHRLAAGGRLTGRLATSTLRYFSGDHSLSISSIASLTLAQPLLQGFGNAIAREPLTQAERNLVYALRTFVRTRESLQISIARKYYAVLNAEDALEIAKKSHAGFQASLERSEAMADANRVNQFEVDQARQRVLTAETNLVSREEDLQTARDELKLALALPLETELEVERADLQRLLDVELPTPPMTLDEAVAMALQQRLDLATTEDEAEDAKRAIDVAEDAMRAKLDLTLDARAASETRNRLSAIRGMSADYSAQLDLDLPFDRMAETIALKRAIMAYQRKLRDVNARRDEITLELRLTWQQLQSYAKNILIQKNSVKLAERRVENTQLLFEGGRIEIRELLDAQDDLSSASTSLTSALVNHRICWLTLLYQLGAPDVEPDTLWSPGLEVSNNTQSSPSP